MNDSTILVVDDEPTLRFVLDSALRAGGLESITLVESAEKGLERIRSDRVAVALVDIVLPGISGIQMLSEVKTVSPDTEVVIMTSHASLDTAVEAIRSGAYDYVQKPFEDVDVVLNTVRRALEKRSLTLRNRVLLEEQERRNDELTAAVSRLSTMLIASHALATSRSLEELLDANIRIISQELDADRVSIMLVDEKTQALRIAAQQGIEGLDVGTVHLSLGEKIAGTVARSDQPLLVTDVLSDPRISRANYPNLTCQSFVSAPITLTTPIVYRERVLGVVNVTNRRSGKPFGESDVSYLAGLSGQLALAIERARQFDALQKAYEDLKAAQEHLVFAERLKALGQMAAGVAHDFNNGLAVILGRVELLEARLRNGGLDPVRLTADLAAIRKAVEQGASTIRRIQEYTRIRRDHTDEPVDVAQIVRDAIDLTRPKWRDESLARASTVEIRTELVEELLTIGDRNELTQVVENLIFNAVEAMPQGGSVTFRSLEDADGRILLEVSDTGTGMSEEVRGRLFEPYFTTKETGHGLGLAIVFGIVSRHQGEIEVESNEGSGSTFRIRLPRARAVLAPRAESRTVASSPLDLLLIDDDETVLEIHRELLVAVGHRVAVARGGAEGLAILGSRNMDVVITDLCMQGMTGLDLASAAKRLHPGLPVILLSGWAMQEDDARLTTAGVDEVLAKPCTLDSLSRAIDKVVNQRAGETEREARRAPEEPPARGAAKRPGRPQAGA